MSDQIVCPECDRVYLIGDLEMWELYEEGKETEFTCPGCDKELIITSHVDSWSFEAEINE